MKTKYITLTKENIGTEHICCAFSDKKCKEGYELKKEWLRKEFDNGYVFRRLDERAKVFIEYVREPSFKACTKSGECEEKNGLVVYFTNRCPYTEYHVLGSLADVAQSKGIPLKIIKLETLEQAQAAPTPATIFTLFHNGQFVTTDLSVCLEKRFEKAVKI